MESKRKKASKEVKKRSITAKISINTSEVMISDDKKCSKILLKKGLLKGEAGLPEMPYKKVFIALPEYGKVENVTCVSKKTTQIRDNFIPCAIQPNEPSLYGTNVDVILPDIKLYEKKKKWPKEQVDVLKVSRIEKGAIAEVDVCPFIYKPQNKSLELIEKMEITVTYSYEKALVYKIKSVSEGRFLKKKYSQLEKRIENIKDLVEVDVDLLDPKFTYEQYPSIDYVIITNEALKGTFEKLAKWRQMLGLTTRVVTVEGIMSGTVEDTGTAIFNHPTSHPDGGTRDLAEGVRNFIKWATKHWCIDYVLIGGDTEIVPMRQALRLNVGNIRYAELDESLVNDNNQFAYQASASTEEGGHLASYVVDDDSATYWKPEVTDNMPILTVKLKGLYPVNTIHLTWGNTYCHNYRIEASKNGVDWVEVYSQVSGSGGSEALKVTGSVARHIRLIIPQQGEYELKSIKVYGLRKGYYGGSAYKMNGTTTHLYMSSIPNKNVNNTLEGDQFIIAQGPYAGRIIPYNESADETTLGWYFVQDMYELPGTIALNTSSYIKIVGPAIYHDNPFGLKSHSLNYIPTDLYYSDIAQAEYDEETKHDWDYNNNEIYGEDSDEINTIPELMIGRASVEEIGEANNFIDKVIYYERYLYKDDFGIPITMNSDFAVSVLFGSRNYGRTNTSALDQGAAGQEAIYKMFKSIDNDRWIMSRLYQDYADVPSADKGTDLEEITKDKLVNAIIGNKNVVSLSAHGSPSGFCGINRNDVDDIENYPGIWFGLSCLTNKIDYAQGECFGETTILNTLGGAVAYVGNTRFGWTGDSYIEKRFWEELFESGILGEMYREVSIISHSWAKYSLNLLGDPAMRVWSDRPITIQVIHPSSIMTGSQAYLVEVLSGSTPIENAVVCCTMSGMTLVKGRTNTQGKATLTINPTVKGTMNVTVSGANTIPYIGSVNVEKAPVEECNALIMCGKKIVDQCTIRLQCSKSLQCGIRLQCGTRLTCKNQLACGLRLSCRNSLKPNCSSQMIYDDFFDINKIEGIDIDIDIDRDPHLPQKKVGDVLKERLELGRKIETEEIESVIKSLPKETRKTFKMMLNKMDGKE